MKPQTLLGAVFLIAALSQFPLSSEGRLTSVRAELIPRVRVELIPRVRVRLPASVNHDEDMFEFARAKLDKASTIVRKRWRPDSRVKTAGQKRKVISTGPNNQYLSAQVQVGRAMAEARGMKRTFSDSMIKATALLAARNKKYTQALSAVGVGLYNDYKKFKACMKKGSQGCTNSVGIVEQLRKVLGDSGFDDLMSVNGDVSLVFAIDTTGSMANEIQAAKNLINAIANYPREGNVDYILSPFNDPGWGKVSSHTLRSKFMAEVNALKATGGGDCKELTMHGIIDAIKKGIPRRNSPIFVFTDAGPKDEDFSEEYNTENAAGLALDQDSPINFFFSQSSCQKPQTFESFQRLIEETEGIGILFNSDVQISEMSDVVMASLDGMSTIKSGGTGRRVSHSTSTKRYTIPIDDTVEKLILVITVQRNPHLVQLQDPRNTAVASTHRLSLGAVWVVNLPRRGSWGLLVPSGVGTHSFKVTSSSAVNIDFDHYFVWTLSSRMGRSSVEIPIEHPLQGTTATAKLLIPLKEKLNMNSLVVDVTRVDDGSIIKQASLRGITATFHPPSVPFKLRLRGLTASGFHFERTSRKVIRTKSTVLRLVYNYNYMNLPRGRRRGSLVRFAIHNTGPTKRFDYKLSTTALGSITITQPATSRFPVSSGSYSYFSARIYVPTQISAGTLVPMLVTAEQRSTHKIQASLRVHFIVSLN